MNVVDLAEEPELLDDAAELLVDGFDEPYGWPTMAEAQSEVEHVLRDGFALALAGDVLLGWIGGLPEYEGNVWELHPLVVHRDYRGRGIGRRLVEAFEQEVRSRGAHTVTLGTDDMTAATSLAGIDLYDDIAGHIAAVRALDRSHPFLFYRKLGYVVTGVVPDANGPGRPDILMSKKLP